MSSVDGGRLERQRVALVSERAVGVAQGLSNGEEGLSQTGPGRLLSNAAPQKGGERVARVRATERQREIGEQRLGLAGGQREGRPLVEPGLEAPEERETEPCHGALGSQP